MRHKAAGAYPEGRLEETVFRHLNGEGGGIGSIGPACLSRIALIGNSLPRRCGLATYTTHVFDALQERFPALVVELHAMNDPGMTYDYPPGVTTAIRQDQLNDYLRAAEKIERNGAELVWVQHEFGIFGGPSGIYLLALLERLSIPVAITLHSVVDQPDVEQRAVMDRLIRVADRLIVMAEKGRSILKLIYDVTDSKISVIPPGVPDRPFTISGQVKPDFRLAGRKVLLTFGLLSPNKGIETMIGAMPEILAANPDAIYVVAGATHPHLVAHEGERYREGLQALAERLGVSAHVRWVDQFLDQETLLDLITAADVYVTPYRNLNQITSGALAYAVALGKPVISTSYHHAAEIIGADNGLLVGVGDVDGFATAVKALLGDAPMRERMAQNAYALGRSMIWRRNVEAAMAEFVACAPRSKARQRLASGSRETLRESAALTS